MEEGRDHPRTSPSQYHISTSPIRNSHDNGKSWAALGILATTGGSHNAIIVAHLIFIFGSHHVNNNGLSLLHMTSRSENFLVSPGM